MASNRIFNQAEERDKLSPELLADFLKLHNRRNPKKTGQHIESYQHSLRNNKSQYLHEVHQIQENINQPQYQQNMIYKNSFTQKLQPWSPAQTIPQYPGQEQFVQFSSEPLPEIWQTQQVQPLPPVQSSTASEKNNIMSFVPDHLQQFYTNLLSNESFHAPQPTPPNLEYNTIQQQRQKIPSPPPFKPVPNYAQIHEPTDEQLKEFEQIILQYCRADASLPQLENNKPYLYNFHRSEINAERKITTSSPIKKSNFSELSNFPEIYNNYPIASGVYNTAYKTMPNALHSYNINFQSEPFFDLNQELPNKGAIPKPKRTKDLTDRIYRPFGQKQLVMESETKVPTVYRQTNNTSNNYDNIEMLFLQHTDRFSDNPDSGNCSVNEESLYCPPSESPQDSRKFRYGRPREAIALYYRLCKDVCKLRAEYTNNKLEDDPSDIPLYKSNRNNNKSNGSDLNHDKNKGGGLPKGTRPNKYKFVHRVVEVELEFDRLIYSATLDMMMKINDEISEFENRLNIPKTVKNISF